MTAGERDDDGAGCWLPGSGGAGHGRLCQWEVVAPVRDGGAGACWRRRSGLVAAVRGGGSGGCW